MGADPIRAAGGGQDAGGVTDAQVSGPAYRTASTPRTLLADAGYFSADNIDAVTAAGIDPLLAQPGGSNMA